MRNLLNWLLTSGGEVRSDFCWCRPRRALRHDVSETTFSCLLLAFVFPHIMWRLLLDVIGVGEIGHVGRRRNRRSLVCRSRALL